MASQNDSGFKTFQVTGSALSAFLVVDLQSDGTIAPAANGVKGIGVLQEGTGGTPSTSYARVKLWTGPGTHMIQVSGGTAITPGTTYSVITGGYVSVATGTANGSNPPFFRACASAVASNGIVVEFVADLT